MRFFFFLFFLLLFIIMELYVHFSLFQFFYLPLLNNLNYYNS